MIKIVKEKGTVFLLLSIPKGNREALSEPERKKNNWKR